MSLKDICRGLPLCCMCDSACCEHVVLPLTGREARFLRGAGTKLREWSDPAPCPNAVKRGPLHNLFSRITRDRSIASDDPVRSYEMEVCGHLVLQDPNNPLSRRECGAYTNPERPDICGKFEAGSYNCHKIRANAGYETINLE